MPDWDKLAANMGLWAEEAGKAAAAMFKPRDMTPVQPGANPEVSDMVKTAGAARVRLLPDRTLIWRSRSGTVSATRPHDPLEPTPVPPDLIDPDDLPF